jgi:lysophospholipase L1-like esterase
MMHTTVWRLAACLVLAFLATLGIAEWIVRRRINDALWAAPITALPSATQALTWPMVADQRRVVVLGDSIAAGWELPPGAAWPEQLQARLPGTNTWRVINAGIPGETAAQGLARTARDVDAWQPHVVLIAFGLNDGQQVPQRSPADRWRAERVAYGALTGRTSVLWHYLRAQWAQQPPAADPETDLQSRLPLEDYQAALRAIVDSVRQARPEARVAFLTLTPVDTRGVQSPSQRLTYAAYATALAATALQIGVPVIDVYGPLVQADPDRIFLEDGVHLTAGGQRLVAETVHAHLRTLIGE